MAFDAKSYIANWQGFREMNERAWARKSLLNAASHLASEYGPCETLGHSHYCYSGDLAAIDLLNRLASEIQSIQG